MINDLIVGLITLFNNFINSTSLIINLNEMLSYLQLFENYSVDFQTYLSGAYFFVGKPLILYVIGFSAIIFTVNLAGAIIMIVSQFIP